VESRNVLNTTKILPDLEETNLLSAARQDPARFGEIYELYVKRVYRYLYNRAGNAQEAEDLTAQTFLAALESLDRFKDDGCFAAWLFGIARNKAVDHYRRKDKPILLNEDEPEQGGEDALSELIRSERAESLAGLIRALPEQERELLRLRYLAELSFRDMARTMKMNEDAVKKSLYRLLERLQRQLEVSND
jgi:RNA polymerase sigma-70 factor (ECF subfamily)